MSDAIVRSVSVILMLGGTALLMLARKKTDDMPDPKVKKTPLTPDEALAVVEEAYPALFLAPPSVEQLAMLMAQSEHETGAWRNMYNFNWGGLKGKGSDGTVNLLTWEGAGSNAVRVRQPFAAYTDALSGARAWLGLLKRKYPLALGYAITGDAEGFVAALKAGGYFTGYLTEYQKSVSGLYRKWLSRLQSSPLA